MYNNIPIILSEALRKEGWDVVVIESIRGSLFDIIAKKDDNTIIVKCVSNVDSIKRNIAEDLISIARVLDATPLIIAEHSLYGPLLDGVVYIRYNIPVITPRTFVSYIKGSKPVAYANRGGIYIRLDPETLRKKRVSLGYSIGSVAYKCNVSRRTIIEYEKGMDAELTVAKKLYELFGEDIFSEIDIINEGKKLIKSIEIREDVESFIGQKLCSFGLKVAESKRDPVNIVSVNEESKDPEELSLIGKIEERTPYEKTINVLKELSSFINFHAVIFVKGLTSKKSLKGVKIVSIRDVLRVDDIDDLIELLK